MIVDRVFFFTREHLKSAREQFEKSAREHLEVARELLKKILPVNSKKCPWTQKSAREPQKCPWTFLEKSARELAKSAREHVNSGIFGTFEENVPVNLEKCPWTFPKNCAREPWKVPVKISKNLPVNAKTCPWTFPKSARERKNMPVNISEKWRFTGTFEVHV